MKEKTIKRQNLVKLWAIVGIKPEELYLSYDDAYEQYEHFATGNDEWAEYHSIQEVEVQEPIPSQGRMWLIENYLFSSQGEALELGDNPELVNVKVVN